MASVEFAGIDPLLAGACFRGVTRVASLPLLETKAVCVGSPAMQCRAAVVEHTGYGKAQLRMPELRMPGGLGRRAYYGSIGDCNNQLSCAVPEAAFEVWC